MSIRLFCWLHLSRQKQLQVIWYCAYHPAVSRFSIVVNHVKDVCAMNNYLCKYNYSGLTISSGQISRCSRPRWAWNWPSRMHCRIIPQTTSFWGAWIIPHPEQARCSQHHPHQQALRMLLFIILRVGGDLTGTGTGRNLRARRTNDSLSLSCRLQVKSGTCILFVVKRSKHPHPPRFYRLRAGLFWISWMLFLLYDYVLVAAVEASSVFPFFLLGI